MNFVILWSLSPQTNHLKDYKGNDIIISICIGSSYSQRRGFKFTQKKRSKDYKKKSLTSLGIN